jgi:hypothetical protein
MPQPERHGASYIQQGKLPYGFDFTFVRAGSGEEIRVDVPKEVRRKLLPGYITSIYINYWKGRLAHIRKEALRAAGGG